MQSQKKIKKSQKKIKIFINPNKGDLRSENFFINTTTCSLVLILLFLFPVSCSGQEKSIM
jgi:hypothetical protein